ncbi:MAG: UDP-N-acetylmuramoyl-L-alanine--D-glutamate ligase [Gammaproteobacteria bacterium]|nr:MAG: UDP-N-acetylmuramoyl-L-alanine--D-glutamate ligase [Gammaproteobacteria bacterium]
MAEQAEHGREPATLVVGLGRSGLACARHLLARGEPFAVADSRPQPPGLAALRRLAPGVPVHLGPFDPARFARARRLLLSPGVAPEEPAVAAARAAGAEILGEVALFAREARAPVAAVTGTNGKSTVTALLGAMAREAGVAARVGGNLGTPALELLPGLEAPPETPPEAYVLELSSFQLETLPEPLGARAAVVLNLSPDHLDRHRDLEAYGALKGRIYRGAETAVLNLDDPRAAALARAAAPAPARCLPYTLGRPPAGGYGLLARGGEPWLARGERTLLPLAALRLAGRHQAANALAALALAEAMGWPREGALEALRRFPGLPHRMQWVAEAGGVAWYDDSKATNLGATLAALEGLPGPVVLIAGGLAKGQDFAPLRRVAGRLRAAVLLGRDAPLLERALAGAATVRRAADMEEAVALAAGLARPGDRVLLSPACASFDLFQGFEHRGRAFQEAVRRRLGLGEGAGR